MQQILIAIIYRLTSSCILFQLLINIELSTDADVALKEQLVKQIDIRFGQAENVETLALANILDPRFKKVHFREPLAQARVVSKITAKITEIQKTKATLVVKQPLTPIMNSDPDNLWNLHDFMVASVGPQELDNLDGVSGELRLFLNSPPCCSE